MQTKEKCPWVYFHLDMPLVKIVCAVKVGQVVVQRLEDKVGGLWD